MKPQQALDRLCALAGIAVEYQDVWGRTRIAGDDAKRALLAALGIACDSPAAVTAASEELEERDWRRALPPVLVLRQSGQPWHVPVTLPGTWRGRQLHWQLQLEGGELRQGTAAVNDLARLAERRIDRVRTLRLALPLPADLDLGYHRFNLLDAGLPGPPDLADAGAAAMTLIVAPERCYLPPALDGRGRVWGPQVQLYTLRSQRNWGIGDFTDLHRLVEWAAANGAGVVGINPLHALFPDAPENASPYGPSSRSGWNPLYLDVEAIPEFAASLAARARVQEEGFQAGLQALRATALVDYAGVAAAKQPVLELLFAQFRQEPPAGKRGSAFAAYCAESGAALRNLARFEALQAHFRRADASVWGWPAWPQEYRDPASAAVAEFCRDHAEQVQFRQYLQWETERQLAGVGRRSWELGLGVGLYLDLAVGVDPGGAEVWAERALYATAAGIGAPPDAYNLAGQDWGLAPPLPQRLRDAAYAPWIAAVRANMRHAGALRIDHVMGLARQFWVPRGFPPDQGAYVAFPLRDLFGIVALESRRNSCLVVGEDLGTVPEEVRRTLVDSGGLSCRPLYFERNGDDGFGAPDAYPAQAVASVGSHDLPPLRGYWQGRDLELRDQLKLFATPQERERLVLERAADRARLLVALEREGLLPAASGVDPVAVPSMTLELCRAVHAYLARAPARILAVAGEDMLDQAEQVNLPGVTAAHHPNWRRKLDCALEDWGTDARVAALVEVLRQARGAGVFPRAQGLPGAGAAGAAARIPLATYRIQLNREFTLAQAAALVPYWHALGISHCYASPYLMARAGSSHGYDITDHAAINPEIGSAAELARWVAALHAHGMGQIVDVVPNHMGVLGGDNPWWQDVLENGEASPHARYFDIDWQPLKEELRGKVLLPVLGAPYGQVLEGGELALAFDAARGELALHYYGHRFPVDPHTYPQVLGRGIERLAAQLGAAHPDLLALQFLLDACGHLPPHGASAPALVAERQRDKEVLKLQLAALAARNPAVARFVAANVAACNGNAGQPASWDALHELIKSQAWRLAYWRVAADDINYRRFFDINDLAALRMEDEAVFRDTHRLLGEWLAAGYVDGLRIDHPDGLYDPAQYFERLQRLAADSGGAPAPLYVVAEKILAAHERLPQSWPIFGTTGYRFANLVNGLFVDAANERRIDRIHAAFIGGKQDFAAIAYRAKRLIMGSALAGELNVLANQLSRIALAGRASCDFTVNGLRAALREVVASFPVYRTYVTPAQLVEDDSRYIDWAVAVAKKRSRAADVSVFDFVGAVLSGTVAAGRSAEEAAAVHAFAMKFQQYTGPVAAKGIEDTAFYRYHRLVSLNEVGSDPRSFGVSPAAFHAASQEQALRWPHTLLATSTHDSKRSEDVRARIDVISELPAEWLLHLRRWRRANRGKKRLVDGQPAPTANDEYLLYQTLLGVWPLEDVATDATALEALHRRVAAYMLKAAREAKLTTGWLNPNREYEQALADFIAALFAAGRKNLFLADFLPFQQRVARFGLVNSLAQTLIKLVAPGVPDIYQGNELWNFSLVDPDNRRAVDYALRQAALADLLRSRERHGADLAAWARTLAGRIDDGRIKLYLTWCGLQLRRRLPELFQGGMYLPLRAQGAHAAHVCAFARRSERHAAIVIAPRLVAGLAPDGALPLGSAVWSDTWLELPADLAGTQFTNVCTGEHGALQERDGGAILTLAAALKNFPVALYADSGLD